MLGGGAYLATRFDWIFYIFGGYLALAGHQAVHRDEDDDDDDEHERAWRCSVLRRFVRIVDGDHGGKFSVTDRRPAAR